MTQTASPTTVVVGDVLAGGGESAPPADDAPSGPEGRRGIGIAHALVILLVLVLAPILALAIAYAASVLKLNVEAVDRGLQGAASGLTLAVDRDIQTIEAVLYGLATSPAVDAQDWGALHAQASMIADHYSGWVALVAPTTQQVLNTLRPYGEPLPLSSVPETVRTVLATAKPEITNLVWGRVSQRSVAAVVVPVVRGGSVLYSLSMVVTPDRFSQLLASQKLPGGWAAILLDSADVVVASAGSPLVDAGQKAAAFAGAITDGDDGLADVVTGGASYKVAFKRLAETGWKIIVAAPEDVARYPTRAWAWTLAAGALASLLLACLAAIFFGRRIAAPLQLLAQQAGAMVRGEPTNMPRSPIREVAAVQMALKKAAVGQGKWIETRIHLAEERKAREAAEQARATVESREDALRVSEERYRGLTEAMASIVWTTNPDGQATDASGWCAITGQSPAECAGFGWLDAVHPDDRDRVRACWKEALGDHLPFTAEFRLRAGDGHYAWYDARAVPVREADGRVREWIGVCLDINGRKSAEERQNLLTAELNHRVRNILASVQAMIGLTAQSAPSQEELARRLQGRVAAMARTHGLLTSERWRGASLTRIIRDELHPYADGDDEAVVLSGEADCLLPPRQALDFAMAIHELATNAAKYGALSASGGRIAIDWSITEEGNDSRLALTWQESGGPVVAPPVRRGFGTRLLESVLGKAPRSSLTIEFNPEGICCRIGMWLATGSGAPMPSAPAQQSEQTPQQQTQQQQQETGFVRLASAMPRILVAEDEPLAALEITEILSEAGLQVVGPATTVREAMELGRGAAIVGGVLDVNLKGDLIFPVADLLSSRGAPVLLVTGYDTDTILPERYRGLCVLRKPIDRNQLIKHLHPLLHPEPAASEG